MASFGEFRSGSPFKYVTEGGDGGSASPTSRGRLYRTGIAVTTITATNTPVKVQGATTATDLEGFTMPVENRLVNDSGETLNVMVNVSVTWTSGVGAFGFFLARNGVVDTTTRVGGTSAAVQANEVCFLTTLYTLAPGDYVEVWVENNASVTNINTCCLHMVVIAV